MPIDEGGKSNQPITDMTWEEVERLEKWMAPGMTDKYRRSVAGRAIALARQERERAGNLGFQLTGLELIRAKDNAYLIGQRDALKARADALAGAVDAYLRITPAQMGGSAQVAQREAMYNALIAYREPKS